MRKMMIVAALIAVAISAEAQFGTNNNGSYGRQTMPPQQSPYGNYDNQGGYGNNYDRNYRDGGYQNTHFLDEMLRDTRFSLQRGIQHGAITQFEARKLWNQFGFIQDKKARFERNGFLDSREQNELIGNLKELNQKIEFEKHDGDRYGRNDRYENRGGWNGGFGDRH